MRISTCPCGNQFAGFGTACGPCKDKHRDVDFDPATRTRAFGYEPDHAQQIRWRRQYDGNGDLISPVPESEG